MNTNTVTKKKTTRGRRKVDMKRIEDPNKRCVTFSKRRGGLFKKASELCVLTGAEIAIMVNSHGGHIYSFGYPSTDSIVDRYLTSTGILGSKETTEYASLDKASNDYNQHYAKLSEELEEEKTRKGVIDQLKMVNNGAFWWDEPTEGLSLDELEQYVASMEELKKKVVTRAEELMTIRGSKSFSCVNQTTNQDVEEFGNYQNMEYGDNSLEPFGMDFDMEIYDQGLAALMSQSWDWDWDYGGN